VKKKRGRKRGRKRRRKKEEKEEEKRKKKERIEIANGGNIAKIWYWGYIKDIW
jgi:hypothetical protein